MGDDHRLALFRSKVTTRKKALSVMKDLVWKTEKKNNKLKQHQKRSNELISRKINFLSLLDGVSTTYWMAFHVTNSFFWVLSYSFPRERVGDQRTLEKRFKKMTLFQCRISITSVPGSWSVPTSEKCERAVIANERKTAGERRGERVTIPQSTHYLVCNTAVFRVVTQRS